ncbi:leptin receptor [Genypterus blacodes]|uniref:leptin receptor n=1 Tax=Genypterus blacodes TaxID=154954 RepID=UPI003F759010
MNPTMVQSVMLTFLVHVFLTSNGVVCLEPEGAAAPVGILDLPWQDELCCDSPVAHFNTGGDSTRTDRSDSDNPRCTFRSMMSTTNPEMPSNGTCLDILCRTDETWEALTCGVQAHTPPSATLDAGLTTLSLRRVLLQTEGDQVNDGTPASDDAVVCDAGNSFLCSVALDVNAGFVAMVTFNVSNTRVPPILLSVPARPVQPSPPVNLSHHQTVEAELILQWDGPSEPASGPLTYEVRYSSNSTHPAWQVLSAEEPRLSLDLRPTVNYTVQVRCSRPGRPPLWSHWSEPHHIYLYIVSYIPEKVVARPGENVTVYCVFNERSIDSSKAVWTLNLQHELPRSMYRAINPQVSQITVRLSGRWMNDLLQCTHGLPYSLIYVEGASININCVTNGDIDAMSCSWRNHGKPWTWIKLNFVSRWADLPCDVMEEREKAGEQVGEMGEVTCQSGRLGHELRTCSIQPLRMNCYKLWLELPSRFGPIRSKPVYLSPTDHVKPHPPTKVKAVSRSTGVLAATWEPPPLPIEGLQCQCRYHSLSTVRAQPEWKVLSPTRVPRAEVVVPGMCRGYVVQVRCMHTNGTGYWSDWSESVYSTPENSRAPERGPDFWRILQEDPDRDQTNVTLLFERLPGAGHSHCVDGFVVQHQTASGGVTRERIELVSSYSFQWSQEVHTVTVEAFNSVGSSSNNINMTLERQPKRRCVQSFHAKLINSTCVSLFWSLFDNSSVPLSMVVQWSTQRQQDAAHQQTGESWARLPYTGRTVYLRGDFFGSEDYGFSVFPVFADGEGEPVHTTATRGDPAAYVLLVIITFLSIVLIVTLILSQNQMKKIVWKDVPNPNKCSWAKGLDLKKLDTLDHLFRPPEGQPAWPLLVPAEKISQAVVVDKVEFLDLTVVQPVAPGSAPGSARSEDAESLLDEAPSLCPEPDGLEPVDPPDRPQETTDSSAQSSVTYATVLLRNPKQEQPPLHLHYKDASSSSSSDEGNFSANNSDISGSFHGGLWELDSYRVGETDDPRRSCSYNSMEKLSKTSEQEDEEEAREETDLYYLGMDYQEEEEESEEEEETKTELLKNVVLDREDCCVEARPLLACQESNEPSELLAASPCGFTPLYLPQFRTAA